MLHSFHNKLDAYKEYNLFYLLDIVLGKKCSLMLKIPFMSLKIPDKEKGRSISQRES